MYKGRTGTEISPHTVWLQRFLLVPPKGRLQKQLGPLREVGRSQKKLAERKVGRPKQKQQDPVKSDSHQETFSGCECGVLMDPKERAKHTVHVTKDVFLLIKQCLWLNNP